MKWNKFGEKKHRLLRGLVLPLFILMNITLAYGSDRLPKLRIGMAADKFRNTRQLAAVFEFAEPRFFHAHHLEVAIGSNSTTQESEAFVSIGPVWRFPVWKDNVFFDFGFAPTFLSGSNFNGRDVGGNFHFTSSLSIGARLGRRKTGAIAFRIQHMSNGSLDNTNPGLDMVGLEVSLGVSP